MVTKRKTTTKKKPAAAKPKTKIVYVYKERKDGNPLSGVGEIVKTGAGAVLTIGITSAVLKALK